MARRNKPLYDPHTRNDSLFREGEIDGIGYRLYKIRIWSTKYSLRAVVPFEHPETGEVNEIEIPVGTVQPNVFAGHPFWIRDRMRAWTEKNKERFPLLTPNQD